jgi:hypothetical protein
MFLEMVGLIPQRRFGSSAVSSSGVDSAIRDRSISTPPLSPIEGFCFGAKLNEGWPPRISSALELWLVLRSLLRIEPLWAWPSKLRAAYRYIGKFPT